MRWRSRRLRRSAESRLWGTPDDQQRFFRAVQRCWMSICARQSGLDLGERMAAAFAAQAGPVAADRQRLSGAAAGASVAAASDPAGRAPARQRRGVHSRRRWWLRARRPALSAAATLRGHRLGERAGHGADAAAPVRAALRWAELPRLWDVDRPADLRAWPPWKDLPNGADEQPASPDLAGAAGDAGHQRLQPVCRRPLPAPRVLALRGSSCHVFCRAAG
jgi:hypothetical protein